MGGALLIRCVNCTPVRGPAQFIPVKNPRKVAAYTGAMDALAAAHATKDTDAFRTARDTINQLKTALCLNCRTKVKERRENPDSPAGKCLAEWERMKREIFHTCGECSGTRAIEANHAAQYSDKMKEYNAIVASEGVEAAEARIPKAERKIERLSQDTFWATHGGVEAMRAEARKCAPLCRMCHALDPSSTSANENRADPDNAKRENYATQYRFNIAWNQAKYAKEKRNYNYTLKRAVGRCERADCPRDGPSGGVCSAGFEQCYDWDHTDETTKECGISKLCSDNKSFATAKPLIDAERAKCRLLCANCHKTRSQWDKRSEAGSSSGSV